MIRFLLRFLARRLVLAVVALGVVNFGLGGLLGSSAATRSVIEVLSALPKTLDTIRLALR